MPKVLVLLTGGTLGMTGTPLEPARFATHLTSAVPELAQLAEIETRIICNLDSSDVGPEQWSALAATIAGERTNYDGFVVIHGTDTMAYTASALAFALRGLDRPVVLTGAQRPLSALRTDARRNLADAVEVATTAVAEVCVCFDGMLLRGCRTTKANAHDYRAFESPGTEPLARLGVDIEFGNHLRRPEQPFSCDPRFDEGVVVVRAWPGMSSEFVDHVTAEARGVVLAAYGMGTVPTHATPVAEAVGRAVERGVDVVVVTQSAGTVDLGAYRNSLPLAEAGAISGRRMRIEAAVPKLMHALATITDREERRDYLARDVAGEQT